MYALADSEPDKCRPLLIWADTPGFRRIFDGNRGPRRIARTRPSASADALDVLSKPRCLQPTLTLFGHIAVSSIQNKQRQQRGSANAIYRA